MITRKFAVVASGLALALTLGACAGEGAGGSSSADDSGSDSGTSSESEGDDDGEAEASEGGRIGVAMPTRSSERWIADGDNVKKQLEALGYEVDLQYAEDDIPTQVDQLDNMITQGADLLVIASIDGTALTSQLESAAENNIPVIAYDRLIRDSEHVDYYATFDNFEVGVQQATSVLVGLELLNKDGSEGDAEGPFNIELFAGSPDDNNATFFFDGAMSILQPYIDDGTLEVKSGQTDFATIAILRWDPATAQSRMENLLTSTYSSGDDVDAVLSPYDGLSIGILGALKGAGYGTGDQPYPIVSGQDAEAPSVKSIIADEQFATIFKDTRELAEATVDMVDTIMSGGEPSGLDTETYDNGVKVVPTVQLPPHVVYKDNYEELLIDSGYYSEDDLS